MLNTSNDSDCNTLCVPVIDILSYSIHSAGSLCHVQHRNQLLSILQSRVYYRIYNIMYCNMYVDINITQMITL